MCANLKTNLFSHPRPKFIAHRKAQDLSRYIKFIASHHRINLNGMLSAFSPARSRLHIRHLRNSPAARNRSNAFETGHGRPLLPIFPTRTREERAKRSPCRAALSESNRSAARSNAKANRARGIYNGATGSRAYTLSRADPTQGRRRGDV